MPEIGEIARLVHYLRKHLVGKTISSVKVQEDNVVYGKAGTTAAQFQKAITGKKVLEAHQQGKYFWMVMSSPPHPLLHASMTGWIKFTGDDSSFYKPTKDDANEWPPKFWKFILVTDEQPPREAAFVDPRRLGRIRLLDCSGDNIRQTPPLNQNGPDPVQDKDILTKEWFVKKIRSKKVPVKAFLLDQANISGVGNWVGDEILFAARIHPEQYTHSLSDAQLDQLYQSLMHVCAIAVETLADSDRFPEDWLMKYRWGKGKKGNQLPTGEKITFLTVGGRTSAVVPSLQKKTGAVAGDVDDDAKDMQNSDSDDKSGVEEDKPEVKQKRKRQGDSKTNDKDTEMDDTIPSKKSRNKRSKAEELAVQDQESSTLKDKGQQAKEAKDSPTKGPARSKRGKSTVEAAASENAASGNRRSARVSSKMSK